MFKLHVHLVNPLKTDDPKSSSDLTKKVNKQPKSVKIHVNVRLHVQILSICSIQMYVGCLTTHPAKQETGPFLEDSWIIRVDWQVCQSYMY